MSQNLSLSNVEKSIKKVTDMIDINLKLLNEDFLIDNYQKPATLRNSILRAEFNNLCKGKTEAKNMEEPVYENNKKIYLCKEDQIRDIPPILKKLFSNPKKYYILGTPSNFSFFYSLLSILNNDFILEGKAQKEKIIDELRNTLVYNLDTFYTQNNYKQKRFKKGVIRENILNSKVFLPQVIHYILDYHNICLVVVDTETYLYTLANDYNQDREYVIMLRKNNYYQPILNSEGNTRFKNDILQVISKILKPEFEIDMSVTVKVSEPVVSKPVVSEPVISEPVVSEPVIVKVSNPVVSVPVVSSDSITLKKETAYKIAELQSIALQLGIDIKKTPTNKNKKKSDLYQEVKGKLNQ